MRLNWLELSGFRSYQRLEVSWDPSVNVLLGANGAGKTNALEAIAYLTSLRSLRGAPDAALINMESQAAVFRGEIARVAGRVLVEVELPRDGRRRAQVNRQRLTRAADLIGHVRAVAFLPDDLDIIKRGPVYRREFLDATAVQLWPSAHLDQAEYERAVRQRNSLLRQWDRAPDPTSLDVWDERLASAGGRVADRRFRAARAVAGRAQEVYGRLAGEHVEVEVDYVSQWAGTVDHETTNEVLTARLLDAVLAAHKEDLDRRVTTVGPHRDDPRLLLGGRDTRTLASQGEQRTLVLAMRLAAHQAVTEAVGEPPLLLLDDVFSELDAQRAAALTKALPPAQTFITTARAEDVPVEGRRWAVGEGRIT